MLVTVSWPIALLGRISSILGSFAVRLNRASAEIRRPGAMAPPKYSPAAVTAQKGVAVPKSTMMIGPPYPRLGSAARLSRWRGPTRGGGGMVGRREQRAWGTTPGGGAWEELG